MLIEKETLKKLCPSYQKAVEEFENEYSFIASKNETSNFEVLRKIKLFKRFSQNYLMLPEFWDEYFRILRTISLSLLPETYNFIRKKDKIRSRALNHFYDTGFGFVKLYHIKPKYKYSREYVPIWKKLKINEISKELNFPRNSMERTMKFYEECSSSPIPKKIIEKFEKMKKLYFEIVKAENDQEKWFKLITQVENEEFVKNNIEYKLGKNLFNIDLWKLYLNYLKENDTKRLLHLYSCYCRFFIDDIQMKNEYKNATIKYGPSKVSWKNLFDFEIFQKEQIQINPTLTVFPKKIIHPSKKFSTDNFKDQIFSLPKTIISYILKCAESNMLLLHKLHQSCKYFFILMPYPICYNFLQYSVAHEEANYLFYEQSIGIFNSYFANFDFKLIISNSINIYTTKRNYMSKLILNIFQSNIKYLRLAFQDLSLKEFQFLVDQGNIEALLLNNVNILNEKQENIKLDEILEMTPKIMDIEIHGPFVNLETFENLSRLNFINKIQFLRLYGIKYFEPYGFCDFIKKNFNSDSEFFGRFETGVDRETKEAAKNVVETQLRPQWPVNKCYEFILA